MTIWWRSSCWRIVRIVWWRHRRSVAGRSILQILLRRCWVTWWWTVTVHRRWDVVVVRHGRHRLWRHYRFEEVVDVEVELFRQGAGSDDLDGLGIGFGAFGFEVADVEWQIAVSKAQETVVALVEETLRIGVGKLLCDAQRERDTFRLPDSFQADRNRCLVPATVHLYPAMGSDSAISCTVRPASASLS